MATLLALVALAATILSVAASATANPSIRSKRAQAKAVLAQIHESDVELEKAIEAYNYANVQLDQIDADLRSNGRHLVVARKSLSVAQVHIADRLRALYVNGDGGGAVEIILGAENLDDLLNRLDMVQRVGDQDSQVLKDVRVFRKEVAQRRAKLRSSRAAQAHVVSERTARKRSIEAQLAERERMLAGLQDEIRQLQAEEARRQALLAAQARARFDEQQRAAAVARAARAASAEAATSALEAPALSGLEVASPLLAEPGADAVTTPAPPAQYGGVVGIAIQYLGVPYVWGGAGPSGFDCSGLVQFVFSQVGVSLPHHAASIYSYGSPVSQSELQPGDLVFYSGLGHMGIYIGGDQYIHAPQTGDVVKISTIYRSGWVGAKRL